MPSGRISQGLKDFLLHTEKCPTCKRRRNEIDKHLNDFESYEEFRTDDCNDRGNQI